MFSNGQLVINYLLILIKLIICCLSPIKVDSLIENMSFVCRINEHKLARVNCVKYLGVWLDANLNWSHNINSLIKKVRSVTGILYRKRYVLMPQCRKTLYFSLIYSSLIYCIEIYGNAKRKWLNPLITKCNSLLRIIQDKSRFDHVKDLAKPRFIHFI